MPMTATQVQQLYVAYFNRPADYLGLQYWMTQDATAASKAFAASAEYAATYAGMDTAARVDAIYQNLFGHSADLPGLTYWSGLIASGRLTISDVVVAVSNGAQGTDKAAYDAKVSASSAFTTALDTTAEVTGYSGTAANNAAKAWLAGINSAAQATAATTTAALNATVASVVAVGGTAGSTYALTTSIDTPSSTSGNDTYNASPGASNANTFTALDVIDGGSGTDTFNVTEIGAAGASAYTLNTSATVRNIEILNYTVSSDDVGDTLTADVQNWSGLKTANLVVSGTDAPVTFTSKGNVTSVSVNGSTTAGVTDNAAAGSDVLASVTASDTTGLVTVTSDALTSLTLAGATGGATVTAAAATRALTVNLTNVTAGTITDAEATSVVLNGVTTKNSGITLTAAKAKALTIDTAVATTLADINVAAATSITAKGAGATTITATSTVTALTSVDASGSTGGLTIGAALGTGVSFTGGSGKDSIILGASTKAITTGGGDDTVTVAGVSALGTGGSVDAGDGTDTLKFSTYANAVTASGTATFEGTVSNFEKVELSGANGAAAAAINMANLDDINYVILSATNTETTTISGLTSGATVEFTADQTATKDATITITNANTNTSDVLNVVLKKATALANVELIAADIETVNVTSTETATTLLGTVVHAAELNITAAKALNISGNAAVNFGTLTGATALTSIDASGITAGGTTTFTTAALTSAATIKGAAASANTIVATAATKAVTYTGGSKVDTITINNAQDNSITTLAGNDIIVTGSGADTINAGDGNDSITAGSGLNVVTGGAGDDTHVIALQANGNVYTTISDFAYGDSIDLGALDTASAGTIQDTTALGAKITLGDTAAFADYLQAATAGDASTNALVKWFQYGGNTYVVVDDEGTASAVFDNGVDTVVRLTGVIDLSKANLTSAVLTLDA